MCKHNLNFVLFVLGVVTSVCTALPDFVQKCKAGDKQCIAKNIDYILRNKYNGSADLGLIAFDPLRAGLVELKQDASSPVGINMQLFNTTINGIRHLQVVGVKGFGKTPDGRHTILLKCEAGTLLSDYNVDGRILILPVHGQGSSVIKVSKPQLRVSIQGESFWRDGVLYMKVKSTQLDMHFAGVEFNFENLFDGDQTLSTAVHALINENWREIYEELRAPLQSQLNVHLHEAARRVFDHIPYTDFFES